MDRVRTYLGQSGGATLRVRIARTSELVREAKRRHEVNDYVGAALERALTSAALIPMSWKDADRVAVQWTGRGALGTVVAEAREDGSLRAYATRPDAKAVSTWAREPRPLAMGLGPGGYISVVQQAHTGQFTQGQTELVTGGFDDDLAGWFERSAQVPTALRVDARGEGEAATVSGLLVQVLPDEGKERADKDALPELPTLNVDAASDEEILRALALEDAKLSEEVSLRFSCPCSMERAASGLAMLTEDELLAMVVEDHGAEIRCEFCASEYKFDAAAICAVIDARRA